MEKRGSGSPTLFLIAINVTGLLDRLLGSDGSNSVGNQFGQDENVWGVRGEDDVAAFFKHNKARDIDLLASRKDIEEKAVEAMIKNFRQKVMRGGAGLEDESESDKAKRWWEKFGEEFLKLFGIVEVQQLGAQREGAGAGAGAGAGESVASLVTGGETTTLTVSRATLDIAMQQLALSGEGNDAVTSAELEVFASVGMDPPLTFQELFPYSGKVSALYNFGVWNAVTSGRAEELKVHCSILEANENGVFRDWMRIVSRS